MDNYYYVLFKTTKQKVNPKTFYQKTPFACNIKMKWVFQISLCKKMKFIFNSLETNFLASKLKT